MRKAYLVGVQLADEKVLDFAHVCEALRMQGTAILQHAQDVFPFRIEGSRHALSKELEELVPTAVLLEEHHQVVCLQRGGQSAWSISWRVAGHSSVVVQRILTLIHPSSQTVASFDHTTKFVACVVPYFSSR